MPEENGWEEYKRLVLAELRRLSDGQEKLNEKMTDGYKRHIETLTAVREEVARLQVKSGVWGGIAGLVTTVGALLLAFVVHLFRGN